MAETDGIRLGVTDEISDLLQIDTLSLNPGDGMLLFTDGIAEAVNANGEMLSVFSTWHELAHVRGTNNALSKNVT